MAVGTKRRRCQSVRCFGRVEGEVELDYLTDRLSGGVAGSVAGIEVKQEALQAVRTSPLGSDVLLHPFVGESRRGKGLAPDDRIVVAEANPIRLPAALRDIGPLHLPRSSHLLTRAPLPDE